MLGALKRLLLAGAAASAVAGGEGFTQTRMGFTSSTSDTTTYTFASQDFGAAAADRYIYACVYSSAGSNITLDAVNTLIGGQAIEILISNGSSTRQLYIIRALVPSGTTGDIVIVYSGTASRCGVGWWRVVGSNSASVVASNSGTVNSSASANSLATSAITVPASGWALAAVVINSGSSSVTWTQTSGSGTKYTDEAIEALTWASSYTSTEAGSQAFTADGADGVAYRIGAIALGPA